MAAAPDLKVYFNGEYRAAFKLPEDAAMFVGALGDGATVRFSHTKRLTIWTEGAEKFPAYTSFDGAAEIMRERIKDIHKNARARDEAARQKARGEK